MKCNAIQHSIKRIVYDTFQAKTEHYWPQKGLLWAIGGRKRQEAYKNESLRPTLQPHDTGKFNFPVS